MEMQHWIGLGALIMTVGVNLVLVTVFAQNIRGDIAVMTTRLNAFDEDFRGITNYGQRLAVAEERNNNIGHMIANMQQENLRLWHAVDDMRHGRGFIKHE